MNENKPRAFQHQETAFNKLKSLDYGALFADMGTGKTRIAIDWFEYKHILNAANRVIVVGPFDVVTQWGESELRTHCSVHYNFHQYKNLKTKKYLRTLDGFIMSTRANDSMHILGIHFETFASPKGLEIVSQFLGSDPKNPPVILIDESSRIKNPSAKSVKAITSLRKLYPTSFRMIMSGTPASKSPVDLWSQFDFLTHNYFNCGYVVFKNLHTVRTQKKLQVKGRLISVETELDRVTYDKIKTIIKRNTVDGKLQPDVPAMVQAKFAISEGDFWFIVNSSEFQRFKNMDKLQEKIAPVTYAVKRADCIDIPPKIYKRIECPLSAAQKKLIKELRQYSATVYEQEMLTVEVKALIGLRILQICGGNFSHLTDLEGEYATKPIKGANSKLNYLMGDVPEIGEQQFIVCAVYTPEVKLIHKKLSTVASVGLLYGDTPKPVRAQTIEDFKAGHIQGLVMNPYVGGYGLNLQVATVQYWYSRNYRTEVRLQAEDRIHRIGTVQSPVYKDLISDIQFEHDVLDVLQEGKAINDIFVNKSVNDVFKL